MRYSAAFLLLCLPLVTGQFGFLNKKKEAAKQPDSELAKKLTKAVIDENGNIVQKYEDIAIKLREVAPISVDDATQIAVLMDTAMNDPETAAMVAKMRASEGHGATLKAFVDDLGPQDVVLGLKQALDELKAIEVLFTNPARAVIEMEKDGLIEKKRIAFYKENPEVLATDTRKGAYFTFVSLAVAGGFL